MVYFHGVFSWFLHVFLHVFEHIFEHILTNLLFSCQILVYISIKSFKISQIKPLLIIQVMTTRCANFLPLKLLVAFIESPTAANST